MTPEQMETQGPVQHHVGHRGPGSPFKQKPSMRARPGLPEPQPLSPAEPPPCPRPWLPPGYRPRLGHRSWNPESIRTAHQQRCLGSGTTGHSSLQETRGHQPGTSRRISDWQLPVAGPWPASHLQLPALVPGSRLPPLPRAKPEQVCLALPRAHGAGDGAGVQSAQGRGSQTTLTPGASRLRPSLLGASSPTRSPPAPAALTPTPLLPFWPGSCPLPRSTLRLHLGLPLRSQSPPWQVPPDPDSQGSHVCVSGLWPPYFPFFSSFCLRMKRAVPCHPREEPQIRQATGKDVPSFSGERMEPLIIIKKSPWDLWRPWASERFASVGSWGTGEVEA
ncbi:uncharacterized protein ACOB7L_002261 [Callospermophilus lateralis]|uniref:uncharacterized protein LOC143383257 n=1 Tax=Callospermophilus lateralis TaxID=76772 RepID=UPI0040546AE8